MVGKGRLLYGYSGYAKLTPVNYSWDNNYHPSCPLIPSSSHRDDPVFRNVTNIEEWYEAIAVLEGAVTVAQYFSGTILQ